MLHVIAYNKNLSVSLFKAYQPIINEWLSEINQLHIKNADSSSKVLYSKESGREQDEIEESTYSMTVTFKIQDMLHALKKVDISRTSTDDKIFKKFRP